MLIGLTGGIGSGKSTIARALAARGYAVYDCDKEAKRLINTDPQLQAAITDLLGPEAFVNGVYNTAYISKCVFSSPPSGGLGALNAIVHPAVKRDILQTICSLSCGEGGGRGWFFIESAILYEAGLAEICDKVIVVDAPEDIRIARTIARDYHGEATPDNINKVRARIRAQQTAIENRKSIILLTNDGSASISVLADNILHWLQNY